MSINPVVLTGKCAEPGPKLTYNPASAKPECKLTLIVEDGKGEQTFSLYVPVFIYGPGAERAAEEVDAGDFIAVDGRLSRMAPSSGSASANHVKISFPLVGS
jgi:single-stranded DNA-binding protein